MPSRPTAAGAGTHHQELPARQGSQGVLNRVEPVQRRVQAAVQRQVQAAVRLAGRYHPQPAAAGAGRVPGGHGGRRQGCSTQGWWAGRAPNTNRAARRRSRALHPGQRQRPHAAQVHGCAAGVTSAWVLGGWSSESLNANAVRRQSSLPAVPNEVQAGRATTWHPARNMRRAHATATLCRGWHPPTRGLNRSPLATSHNTHSSPESTAQPDARHTTWGAR